MSNTDTDFWSQFEDIGQAKVYNNAPVLKFREKGDKARICFPLVNPKSKEVAFKKLLVFNFNDPVKGTWARIIAPEDKSSKAYQTCVKYCGEPQVVRLTPVLVYSTNATGRVLSGEEYSIVALKVTPQRLESLKLIQDEFNLAEHDVAVSCSEIKYQKISFTALPQCGLRAGKIKQQDKTGATKELEIKFNLTNILNEAMEFAKTMETAVGSKWTEQQIISYFEKSNEEDADFEYDDEDEEDTSSTENSDDIDDEWN